MRDGSALVRTADDPLIGATIANRYVIEALVGEGAMGLVYRARHARLSRVFALKLMFGDVAADPTMRMRFAQEADAASRMSHPNVVSVLDFGKTENGLLYLAMEYADGETLASVIEREAPLAEGRVIGLARQMARGLGHAHRAGLVHRDFKPANVATSVSEDGTELVRILDFGLAISEGDGTRIGRLTEHGLVVGTPMYISPEQARDLAVDHRADLFALGVVMYEMLTGKPPFEGTGHEIARANVTLTPPPFAERNPNVRVSPELEALVLKLMSKQASDRFQSAEDVIAALARIGKRAAPVAVPKVEPIDVAPARERPYAGILSPIQWLLEKSAMLRWGPTRTPTRGDREAAGGAVARPVDVGCLDAIEGPTIIEPVPFGARQFATGGKAHRPVHWGAERDAQATVAMGRALANRPGGVLPRQAPRFRRRGMMAVVWFALATSGVLCTLLEGDRPAAGKSDDPITRWAEVAGGGTVVKAAVPERALTLTWLVAVSDQIQCALGSMAAHPAQTARGQFEGKMGSPRPRRCPTVQNAEPIGDRQLSSSPALSAGTPLSPRSLPAAPGLPR